MNSVQQYIADLLTSGADDIWSEIQVCEEKGISATDALISILQDTGEAASDKQAHMRKRINAAYGLKKLRDPGGIPALINVLHEPNESLGIVASSALVAIGSEAVEPLISALSNSNRHFRFFAIGALSELQDNRAVEPLISLLQDPQAGGGAAIALGELGDPKAVAALINAIHTHEPGQCRPFVVALGEIGDPRAIQPLLECLPNFPDWVRLSVAEALAAIGSPAEEALLNCLNSVEQNVREGAAIALGMMGLSNGIELLKVTLRTSPSTYIRSGTACALGIIQDPSALELLILAMKDSARGVRIAAIKAIKQIGVSTETTNEMLISALHNRDPFEVGEVVLALSRIGNDRAIPELERLIREDDKRIVFHAPEIVGSLGEVARHAIEQINSRVKNL